MGQKKLVSSPPPATAGLERLNFENPVFSRGCNSELVSVASCAFKVIYEVDLNGKV